MCRAATTQAGGYLQEKALHPLFEMALRHADVTAWICSNDGIALAALRFLRSRKIPVPEKISVAGFDNEPFVAVEQQLTTFDFNAQGFVYSILNFLAQPSRLRGPYHHVPIEVEGMVMQRDSVKQLRKPRSQSSNS